MEAEAQLAPKHLAEALENAVLGSKEKQPLNPTIEVALTTEGLRACGFTRWSGVIDRRPTETREGEAAVLLDYEQVAEFSKDVLRKVKGFSTKGASVDLKLSEEALTVVDGSTILGRLERSEEAETYEGDAEHQGFYEYLYDLEAEREPLTPIRTMRLMRESFLLVKDVKMSTQEDGKWVAAQPTDRIEVYGLTDKIVGIEYGTARVLLALGAILELDEE